MDGFLVSDDWFSRFSNTKFDKLKRVTPNSFLLGKSWIWNCNSTILVISKPTSRIQAFKNLRQEDLLSPFLFLVVLEVLSRLVSTFHYP